MILLFDDDEEEEEDGDDEDDAGVVSVTYLRREWCTAGDEEEKRDCIVTGLKKE